MHGQRHKHLNHWDENSHHHPYHHSFWNWKRSTHRWLVWLPLDSSSPSLSQSLLSWHNVKDGTVIMLTVMSVPECTVEVYLVFVHFGTPPHYLGQKKSTPKSTLIPDVIGQNFTFSMLKVTPALVVAVVTNKSYVLKLSWRVMWRVMLRMEILIIMIHTHSLWKDNNDNDHIEQSWRSPSWSWPCSWWWQASMHIMATDVALLIMMMWPSYDYFWPLWPLWLSLSQRLRWCWRERKGRFEPQPEIKIERRVERWVNICE